MSASLVISLICAAILTYSHKGNKIMARIDYFKDFLHVSSGIYNLIFVRNNYVKTAIFSPFFQDKLWLARKNAIFCHFYIPLTINRLQKITIRALFLGFAIQH